MTDEQETNHAVARSRSNAGLEADMETRKLETLAEDWERSARNKFSDAEREKSDFGRRFIEHGAMCYFNCAQALREALGVALPRPLPTPPKRQKQHRRRA